MSWFGHYQEYECIKCGKHEWFWTWTPSFMFKIDFLYLFFHNCVDCLADRNRISREKKEAAEDGLKAA
jgi:hypothetical protein